MSERCHSGRATPEPTWVTSAAYRAPAAVSLRRLWTHRHESALGRIGFDSALVDARRCINAGVVAHAGGGPDLPARGRDRVTPGGVAESAGPGGLAGANVGSRSERHLRRVDDRCA